MEEILKLIKAYKRFMNNRAKSEIVYLYPEYDKDLDTILEFVCGELEKLISALEE